MESDWLNSITFYWSGCCQMYTHTSPSKRCSPLTLWAHLFLIFLGKVFPFWQQCCLPPLFFMSLAAKQITLFLCSSTGTKEKELQCVNSLCHAAMLICINSSIHFIKKKSTQSETKGKAATNSRTPNTTWSLSQPCFQKSWVFPYYTPYWSFKTRGNCSLLIAMKFITSRVKWELAQCISQCSKKKPTQKSY